MTPELWSVMSLGEHLIFVTLTGALILLLLANWYLHTPRILWRGGLAWTIKVLRLRSKHASLRLVKHEVSR